MYNYQKYLKKIGIDEAIAYTILGRIIQATGGIISIFFLAKYLTKTEQGFYYTFTSIIAIQIFFELGLSNIIIQFVAHEKAYLLWDDDFNLIGDEKSKSRIASLYNFFINWFTILASALLFILIIIGFLFFTKYNKSNESVIWKMPWIILCFSTALNLLLSPILSFLEGLGKVKEVAKIKLIQQSTQTIILFGLLILKSKLFSSPIASLISIISIPLSIYFSDLKKILQKIKRIKINWKVNYWTEIYPFQWKIAVSWISGYFIFQLFNPVIFATEGPIIAGQMGMTLAILNGILTISLSWINTKVQLFSSYIAKRDFEHLNTVFKKTIAQSAFISLIFFFILFQFVYYLQSTNVLFGKRFLPINLLFLLIIATFLSQLTSAIGTYLRCHKQEPFLLMSIVISLLNLFSIITFGKSFGIKGIIGGYLFLTTLSFIWSIYIYKKKSILWHNE